MTSLNSEDNKIQGFVDEEISEMSDEEKLRIDKPIPFFFNKDPRMSIPWFHIRRPDGSIDEYWKTNGVSYHYHHK